MGEFSHVTGHPEQGRVWGGHRLLENEPEKMIEEVTEYVALSRSTPQSSQLQAALSQGSEVPTFHPTHFSKTLCLHSRSPTALCEANEKLPSLFD